MRALPLVRQIARPREKTWAALKILWLNSSDLLPIFVQMSSTFIPLLQKKRARN
jgi:hypothetical protein